MLQWLSLTIMGNVDTETESFGRSGARGNLLPRGCVSEASTACDRRVVVAESERIVEILRQLSGG
jgi:hypothetical protein